MNFDFTRTIELEITEEDFQDIIENYYPLVEPDIVEYNNLMAVAEVMVCEWLNEERATIYDLVPEYIIENIAREVLKRWGK